MLNYLIRFSFCLFSVCFTLFFYHYITLYYFLQFSNIIIHTHVTWLASAYYCFFCFLLCVKEGVGFRFSLFLLLLFVGFFFLSQLSTELSSIVSLLSLSLSIFFVSISLARAIARPSFFPFLPSPPSTSCCLLLRLLRLLFSLLLHLHLCLPPACTQHTTHLNG